MIHRPVTYLPNTHDGSSQQTLHKNLRLGEIPSSKNKLWQHRKDYRDEPSVVKEESYSGSKGPKQQSGLFSSIASSRTVLGSEALKNKRDNQFKVRVGICFLNSIDAEAYSEKLHGTGSYQVVTVHPSQVAAANVVAILTDHCLSFTSGEGIPRLRIQREKYEPCSCCINIQNHGGWNKLLQQIEQTIDKTGVSPEQLEEPPAQQEVIRTTHAARRGLPAELDSLTKRELDILQLVGKGMSVRDMAEHLQLAESTVGNHKYRLMKKLGAKTSLELLKIAIRCGLADID